MGTKLLTIVLALRIFLPCELFLCEVLHAEDLPWTKPKISQPSPSQNATNVTLNKCCICYYDPSPGEPPWQPDFKRACELWLQEPAQIFGCAFKTMVALPSDHVCPPESCADAFPGQNCDTLTVQVNSHSSPSNCKPFINAAVSLCLSVGTQCGEITHNGCSTFENYEQALEYLRTLQREHPDLHLRITANQCASFMRCGRQITERDTPCLIIVEPGEISCTLPRCDFGRSCDSARCDDRSSCSESVFRDGQWKINIRKGVCCSRSRTFTPIEDCDSCNGVCCGSDGNCQYRNSVDCQGRDSLWKQGVSSCGPEVCPKDIGACCEPPDSADICSYRKTREQCGAGKWFRGQSCDRPDGSYIDCEETPGACCRSSGCEDGITNTLCGDAPFVPNGICPMACHGDPGPGITNQSSPKTTTGSN